MEENEMDKITTEMAEFICDKICREPIVPGRTQDELEDICAECPMGGYICRILNQYNHINDFDKSQSKKMLIKIAELNQLLDEREAMIGAST